MDAPDRVNGLGIGGLAPTGAADVEVVSIGTPPPRTCSPCCERVKVFAYYFFAGIAVGGLVAISAWALGATPLVVLGIGLIGGLLGDGALKAHEVFCRAKSPTPRSATPLVDDRRDPPQIEGRPPSAVVRPIALPPPAPTPAPAPAPAEPIAPSATVPAATPAPASAPVAAPETRTATSAPSPVGSSGEIVEVGDAEAEDEAKEQAEEDGQPTLEQKIAHWEKRQKFALVVFERISETLSKLRKELDGMKILQGTSPEIQVSRARMKELEQQIELLTQQKRRIQDSHASYEFRIRHLKEELRRQSTPAEFIAAVDRAKGELALQNAKDELALAQAELFELEKNPQRTELEDEIAKKKTEIAAKTAKVEALEKAQPDATKA